METERGADFRRGSRTSDRYVVPASVASRVMSHRLLAARKAAGIANRPDRRLNGTLNPLGHVQFGEGAFPEFSQSLLLTRAFEEDD